jgi:glycine/D-amino acid oxidase-like deaminating enzyme
LLVFSLNGVQIEFVFRLKNFASLHKIHIVGQGLVGSLLAFRLIEAGYKPVVFDKGHKNASSMVAAGMWNPVNFKRLNVGQQPERYLAAMHDIYPRLEQWLDVQFFQSLPIVRLFESQEEINNWDLQSALGKTAGHYLTQPDFGIEQQGVNAPLGAGLVEAGGRIDMPMLLKAMRIKLKAMHLLVEEDYVLEEEDALVIHCTGMDILTNPLWSWLPMAPNKGQVLTMRIPGFDSSHIYHFGRFVVPMHADTYKLGSTYELRPENREPDSHIAQEILADFQSTIRLESEIIEHQAGYRPTTFDRMPIVGPHPISVHHYVCNGFGSRGVYYAPLCIEHLLAHLTQGIDLPAEISIGRTRKHYDRWSSEKKQK